MTNDSDIVALMAELHAALAPGDLAETLRRVTEAAVELLPAVDGATITVEHPDGRFETAAATGSVDAGPAAATAARLDRLQRELDEGPAVDVVDAATEGAADPGQKPAVTASDLSRDDRYPAYRAVAVDAGVHAQVAVELFDTSGTRGVLNLYSQRPGAFDDTALLTDLFVHHSATALAYAADYQDRETTVAERRAVGQALGIVMERYTLTEANAYALLQRTAQHRMISVRLVAQELVARAEGVSFPE